MRPRFRILFTLGLLALVAPARPVLAQGLIVDPRPNMPLARSYEIREVSVDSRLRDQVAEVQVSQTFHNPGSQQIEAEYLFPMPEEGAVQNFVLLVDGKEMPGRLLAKEEARKIYEEIVRTKRDPALLEYMGRGLFKTSVFPIPPGAERKVTLRYTQLCKRDRDVVEFTYPFGTQKFTSKPIQRLSLTVRIDSKDAIKSVYSPSHDVTIKRIGDHEANVTLEQRDVVPTTDFRLVYTLSEGTVGASVLSYRPSESEDGYFLLLASPDMKSGGSKPQPKTVVFVLDRSGSMTGKKIEQARDALKFCLDNLRDDDTFNIVVYDDRVETYKPELQRYSKDSREDAKRFVDNIRPGGSTNIDSALKSALGLLQDDSRPQYVLFLTDGLPTAGETGEMKIVENAHNANGRHARLFAFGVGFDVNARLLDRLSGGNGGASEYVTPDENIEADVSRFYAKLTSPVLAGIHVELSGTDVNRTYPRDIPDLFEGGQLVMVGRYRQPGRTTVRMSGKVDGEGRSFEFPAELEGTGRGNRHDYVEKLWAVRRVGDIIDQIDLHGQSKELTDELVALSTKYGILTPYTSFLADEGVQLHAATANATRAHHELEQLSVLGGSSGVGQRSNKAEYQHADRAAAAPPAGAPGAANYPIVAGVGGGGLGGGGVAVTGSAPAPADYNRVMSRGAGGGPAQQPLLRRAGAMPNPATAAMSQADYNRAMGRMQGMPGMAGMGGGMGYGVAGNMVVAKDAEGKDVLIANVRNLGKKTFYRKENRWVDSDVKPEENVKPIVIKQFSDAYFTLARNQSAEWNQYLTFEEPVTVKLDGKVYLIEPAEPARN